MSTCRSPRRNGSTGKRTIGKRALHFHRRDAAGVEDLAGVAGGDRNHYAPTLHPKLASGKLRLEVASCRFYKEKCLQFAPCNYALLLALSCSTPEYKAMSVNASTSAAPPEDGNAAGAELAERQSGAEDED